MPYNQKTLKQGWYHPQHPKKYKGNINEIVFRSGLELKYMRFFDLNPKVLKWNSEEIFIPYHLEIDNKTHRYFIDFWIRMKNTKDEIVEYLIEVKPHAFTMEPEIPVTGRITKTYKLKCLEWIKNRSKWKYAQEYAKKKGMKFIILTENDL